MKKMKINVDIGDFFELNDLHFEDEEKIPVSFQSCSVLMKGQLGIEMSKIYNKESQSGRKK